MMMNNISTSGGLICSCEDRNNKIYNNMEDASTLKLMFAAKIFHVHSFLLLFS